MTSWGRLGVVEWGFAEAKLHFVKNHVFNTNQVSRDDLGRSWIDLGAQEGPKGRPKGPKVDQKRYQNDTKHLIDFGNEFGPILGAQEIKYLLGCGMRGAWLKPFEFKEF